VNRSKNGLPQKAWSLGRKYGVTLTSSASTLPTEVEGGRASQLSDEVAYLRDANRRKDEIIMQQAMTHAAYSQPGCHRSSQKPLRRPSSSRRGKERAPGPLRERLRRAQGPGPGDDASSEGSLGHHSSS
jgi:hypothetical protein